MTDETKTAERKLERSWQEPSERAAAEITENAQEFLHDYEASGPDSQFHAGQRVDLGQGARVPQGRRERSLEGEGGFVVGASYVAGEDSPHRGKVCRGVQLDDGRVVTTPEENIRSSRVSVGFSHVSQERWDRIFGRSGRKKR